MTTQALQGIAGLRAGLTVDVEWTGAASAADVASAIASLMDLCVDDDVERLANEVADLLRRRVGADSVTVTATQRLADLDGDDPRDNPLIVALREADLTAASVSATATAAAPAAAAAAEHATARGGSNGTADRMPSRESFDGEAGPAQPVAQAMPLEQAGRHVAVVALESSAPNAEDLFRASIVAVDSIPGNQVEGISPLYHAGSLDGADSLTAILQVATTMNATELVKALHAVAMAHEGIVRMTVLGFDGRSVAGVAGTVADDREPRTRAAFLSPWLDIDPTAELDGDPVAFLLASALDAPFVGQQSDHWILGGR
ncbi:hypothetical protein [Bifidobacterium choloepi]|uniref:Dihydroneopterin aldolase n=1 Tax=Bifidobacterium choloepi TaxID=2614131 RepID=A0A6I5N099_9BIFI|nr:hypothetical protein [Bifidobacterium choloepi]NEG69545.1 hypothetical protein [Bifidobacterium choloepi]